MKKYFLFYVITFVSFANCNNVPTKLAQNLNQFSKQIDSRDQSHIREICTEKGFKSILEWSNNLTDDRFMDSLVDNLSRRKGIFDISEVDSLVYLSLGKPDAILGATGGYLILLRVDKELKIDAFRGGK